MKRKKILAVFIVVAMLITLLPTATANTTIYFTAINDNMLPLLDGAMPAWIDGQLYVPYTVFDKDGSGTDMGTNASYSQPFAIVTVYSVSNSLVFDLTSGQCKDQKTGTAYPYKAMYRNGTVYLPVAGVCNFFGLTYTYQKIEYGYLLRLKGANVVLSDVRFIDAAGNMLKTMYNEYQQDMSTPQVMVPEEEFLPEEVPEEEIEEEEEEIPETELILGIDMVDYNVKLPEQLSRAGIFAIFFFSPEQLESQGNLLRSLLGQGHFIGLEVTGETLEEVKAQLELGNDYLKQQALTSTQIIVTGNQWKQDLSEEGYLLWQGGEAKPIVSVNVALGTLTAGGARQYLMLEQTEGTLENWTTFYRLLQEEGYQPLLPMEHYL